MSQANATPDTNPETYITPWVLIIRLMAELSELLSSCIKMQKNEMYAMSYTSLADFVLHTVTKTARNIFTLLDAVSLRDMYM